MQHLQALQMHTCSAWLVLGGSLARDCCRIQCIFISSRNVFLLVQGTQCQAIGLSKAAVLAAALGQTERSMSDHQQGCMPMWAIATVTNL